MRGWLLLLLATALPAHAADYWVKNGGNDGADGLSVATAWATLNHAADEVDPGDTVHVLDGSYQGFYLERSGTPGNPITFQADGSDVRITSDNGTTPDGINLEGASHVVIDGFIVNDRTRTGIRAVLAEFVTIRNCRAGNNGRWGILTGFVDDVLIEDNEMHHSQLEHGIYVSNSGDRPVIRRNHSHDNHGNGIHMNGDVSEGGDGVISGALVEGNVVHGNGVGGGSGINMDGVTTSVIRNNLLYDNHASGISAYRIDGGSGSNGNLIANNTIVQASDGRWAVNIRDGSTGNTVVNNILWNLHASRGAISIDIASRPGFASDYNAVISRFSTNAGSTVIDLAAWQALGYDASSFVATPAELFLTPGTDFHLRADAPALDAGTAIDAPSTDLDGNPRPVGAGVDIGAYELQLLECSDGGIDPGEQCGEPGLSCADPCTACSDCICALVPPVCGDATVCGAEECESDGDCGSGEVCDGCQCTNPSLCTSGIVPVKPSLKLRATPYRLSFKAEVTIATPWQGVDPPANGIRLVVDASSGGDGVDVAIPGGADWTTNGSGTRWRYKDATGLVATVQNKSNKAPGLLKVSVKAKGASATLPAAESTRTTIVLGDAGECASIAWNPPGGAKPRCEAKNGQLRCR